MDPQGPKAIAPRTSPAEPAAEGNEAAPPPVVREQDRLLPVANVSRIMRRALPPHAKVSDDAKEVIQDCVSEFISFITGEANDRCHNEHRKTVTAEDIVWAMSHLGFDDYVGPLNAFLQRMREREGGAGAGGSGRGSRRGSSLLELHGVQTTRSAAAAMYRHPHQAAPPPQQAAYAVVGRVPSPVPVPVPGPASSASTALHFGGRYQMAGGGQQQQRTMMISYYGGGPVFQAEGSHGRFYADEASSSNEAPPAPRAGPRSR